MKKLKKFLAVMVAVSSALSMPIVYASDPRGEEDCCGRLRRYSEMPSQTPCGFARAKSKLENSPNEIDTDPWYFPYAPDVGSSSIFWAECVKWRLMKEDDKFKNVVHFLESEVEFEKVKSRILHILEAYFADMACMFFINLTFECGPDTMTEYLKFVSAKFEELHTSRSDKENDYYSRMAIMMDDLPKLVVCPPVLNGCLNAMEHIL